MEEDKRNKLRRKANRIRQEMRELGQMFMGSINIRRIKCGKANCKCTRGQLHECWYITYKERGKTKTISIPKDSRGEALMLRRNYRKMKKLIKELSIVNLELIRGRRKSKDGKGKGA